MGAQFSQDDGVPVPDFLDSVPYSWSHATHQGRLFLFDAFISHASADVERSRALSGALSARGLRVWHDDEQRMGDARWVLRLGKALRNSRFVVVVAAPASDLMARPWVPIECRSALDAEAALPGTSRLLIGRARPDAPVPAEFASCKQFNLEAPIDELVALVQAGNRLPPLGRTPSTWSLSEAQEVIRSARPPAGPSQDSSDESELSKRRVLHALMSSVSTALADTLTDPNAPSFGLYQVWGMSQMALEEPVSNDDVAWLSPALEALTAAGHAESRANACFGLRGLAAWGASDAAAALRRVVVREENEDIVQLVAEWFGATTSLDWSMLPAEDRARVLLMLPWTNVELRNEVFARLPVALRVVALPGIVHRVTQRAFDRLKNVARVAEAHARFEELRRNGSTTDWEVYFRELQAFVGVNRPLERHDQVPLPERVDTYLLLVNEFARREIEQGSNVTWRMMYEPALLMPLSKLSVHERYRGRAIATYNAVLDAMEAPVRRDLEARLREDGRTRRELELAARLFMVEALRRGPYFEQMEGGVYVTLTALQDTVELMRRAEEVNGREPDTELAHDPWTGVEL